MNLSLLSLACELQNDPNAYRLRDPDGVDVDVDLLYFVAAAVAFPPPSRLESPPPARCRLRSFRLSSLDVACDPFK